MTQLIDSVRDSLRLAKEQEKNLQEAIGHLEQTLKLLAQADSAVPERTEVAQATTPDDNLKAVIGILRSHGSPMRRSEIAKQAVERGIIASKSGPSGVDPIVGNILSRNEPRLFVNTGWGWWDLAERQKAEPEMHDARHSVDAVTSAVKTLPFKAAK